MTHFPLFVLLILGQGQDVEAALPAAGPKPSLRANVDWNPITEPCEVLRPDDNWCGPRILYFFACYYGQDRSLDEVIRLCNSDEDGFTSLLDLVRTARTLDLDPLAIRCDCDQLVRLGGPAVISVRLAGRPEFAASPQETAVPTDGVIHFVGLIACKGDDCLIIDPALSTRPSWVPKESLRRVFTGYAVLLRNCPRPDLISWPVGAAVLSTLVAVLAVVLLARRVSKPITTLRPGAAK